MTSSSLPTALPKGSGRARDGLRHPRPPRGSAECPDEHSALGGRDLVALLTRRATHGAGPRAQTAHDTRCEASCPTKIPDEWCWCRWTHLPSGASSYVSRRGTPYERHRTARTDQAAARGWSTCGAERAQTAASLRECGRARRRLSKPNHVPSIASSCAHNEMVRRGSTVRVR
jgi:hypothetical protein